MLQVVQPPGPDGSCLGQAGKGVVGVGVCDVIADVPQIDVRQRMVVFRQSEVFAESLGEYIRRGVAIQDMRVRVFVRVADSRLQMGVGGVVDEFELYSKTVATEQSLAGVESAVAGAVQLVDDLAQMFRWHTVDFVEMHLDCERRQLLVGAVTEAPCLVYRCGGG
ncbi:hypothetical protein ACFXG4_09025 [Nocardia sp. NPDC059246]|uniref:hypothetical protein n=1 Tax=Nocardia sp. NPDC059246 TaxID=3346789 RepID=UPI00367737E9